MLFAAALVLDLKCFPLNGSKIYKTLNWASCFVISMKHFAIPASVISITRSSMDNPSPIGPGADELIRLLLSG